MQKQLLQCYGSSPINCITRTAGNHKGTIKLSGVVALRLVCFSDQLHVLAKHILLTYLVRNRVIRGSSDNVYQLDAYAGSILWQYAFRVLCPCGLTVVYEIFTPLNLASLDIACTELVRGR